MVDLKELAEQVYQNKLEKHFNVTDLPMEICYIHGEVSEMWDAIQRKRGSVGGRDGGRHDLSPGAQQNPEY